jgi:acyl-CoA synthetase (AMP-forming)/AMP-acid ligase II
MTDVELGVNSDAAPLNTAELGWIAPELVPATIDDIPRHGAEHFGERVALVEGDARTTYAELERRTAGVAAGLRAAGLRDGDRVALLLANSADYFAAYFGITRAGGVAVPIGTRLHAREIAFLLEHSGVAMLVGDAPNTARAELSARGGGQHLLELDALAAMEPDDHLSGRRPEDDAAIFYTSGTTAEPKGVRLSHRGIVHAAAVTGKACAIDGDDVALALLPLYHTTTHFMAFPTLIAGGRVVAHEGFRPADAFDLIARHGVTLFPAVTAIAVLMAAYARQEARVPDLTRLRYVFFGGAGVPRTLVSDWARISPGTGVVNCYGLTEMGPPVSALIPGVHEDRAGSIGPAYEGIDARITDHDGHPVPTGEVGEILVRGESMMTGYWRNENATKAALRDGWLRTGDLGYQDADGYLWIAGREKHLIKRGGENVFPNEVEDVLSRHPDVAEALVVAVPDDVMGERVCAIVSARAGAALDGADVVAHCREHIADYKVPEHLVIVPGELPKNSVGKVDVRLLQRKAGNGELPLQDFRRGRAQAASAGHAP